MTATIHIKGIVGEDTTLVDVIRQFKSFDNPTEIEVMISSPGGFVDEGNDIYNYLKNTELPVTTRAEYAYSIAASIFMLGSKRIVNESGDVLMIHLPWAEMTGSSKEFESASKELKALEKEFVDFYKSKVDLDESTIYKLLENETFLSASEAVELGFATEIYTPIKAVALYKKNTLKNMKKDKKNTKNTLIESFNAFFNLEAKALLELQDSNGNTIVFPELDENETPSEGDKVEKDGNPYTGEILMPDGSKLIAKDGVIKEIIEAEEEEEETETEEEAKEDKEDKEDDSKAEAKEAAEKAELVKMLSKFKSSIKKDYEAKIKALQEDLTSVKKGLGSDIENEPKQTSKPKQESKDQPFSLAKALHKSKNK